MQRDFERIKNVATTTYISETFTPSLYFVQYLIYDVLQPESTLFALFFLASDSYVLTSFEIEHIFYTRILPCYVAIPRCSEESTARD